MSAMHAMALPENDPDRRAAAICRAHGRTVRRRAARGRGPAGWTVHGQVPAGQALSQEPSAGAAFDGQAPSGQAASSRATADTTVRRQAPSSRAVPGPAPAGRAFRGQVPAERAPSRQAPSGRAPSDQAVRGQAARDRGTAAPLRLTRRGRAVIAIAAAILVAVVSLIAAGAVQATSHSVPPRVAEQDLSRVVVRPGQSLWSVAESADPHADTRLVVQQIIELNSLAGDAVAAGQQLWVPRG
jgi:hypothetical protein